MATLSTPGTDAVPVHEMVVLHRIFRTEFRRLARLLRRCPDGHTAWAAAIGEHADFVATGLHYHHATEDELVWPLVLERSRPDAELLHRMERQHQDVAACLSSVRTLLADWRTAPTADAGRAAADAVDALSAALAEHLDDEETHILPLLSRHLTLAEWQRVGEKAFAKFTDAQKMLALGLLFEVATPEEAASFLAGLPRPVLLIWRLVGRRRYARYVTRLEGRFNPTLRRWMSRANRVGVALYRASRGRIGGRAKGIPVLLLTAPGHVTGMPRTVPLAYVRHDGGYLVAATAGGSTIEPQWFANVRAAQHVEVQVGDARVPASCRVLGAEERERLWRDVVLAQAPAFGTYEKRCARPVPLAVLTPER